MHSEIFRTDVMELIKYKARSLNNSDTIGEFFDKCITVRVYGGRLVSGPHPV